MEIFFHTANGEDEEEKKSVFVKIPLTGEAGKNFKQVIVKLLYVLKCYLSRVVVFILI